MSNPALPDLALSPSGHLTLPDPAETPTDRWAAGVVAGFRAGPAAGLFALATGRPEIPLAPDAAYWRDVGCRFLEQRRRCAGGST